MNKSESIKEISKALLDAQKETGAATKDATNPHFRSKYADLTSVIEAVKGPLNNHGITFLQPVSLSDAGVCVETVLMHSSGEWISESLTVPVSKHDAQGVGSAISYGRRYGLQSMCGVPAEDDDGNLATSAAPKAKPKSEKVEAMNIKRDLYEELSDEDKELVNSHAAKIKTLLNRKDISGARDELEECEKGMSQEVAAAMWYLLDSEERTALKNEGKRRKDAATA